MSDLTLKMLLFGEDRTASRSLKSLGDNADSTGKHLSGVGTSAVAMGAAIGTMAAQGATALLRMGGSAIKSGVQTAAAMEQANISFTTLLGSGKQAQTFLGDLSKFAAATPFELPGLVDASRQLLGAGAAAKDVIPTLTAFGDASGALGLTQDQFNHIMLATTQAMSAGTLHAGDLLQMTEAGLPVWKLMSEALGKPVSTLKAMSEKGQLLSKDVLPKLQAQMEKDYGGAMGKQSQTLSGLWSTLMDTFNQGMAKAIIPMEPMLRSLIPKAANVMGTALTSLGTGASQFFGGLSGNVKRMNQSDRPKLELFGLGIRAMGQAFQDGGVTSKGFIGVMERIGVVLRQVAGVVQGALKQAMTWIRTNGPKIFSGLLTSVENLASVALPLVIQAWEAFRKPLQTVMQFIINTALPAITAFTGWLERYGSIIRIAAVGIGAVVIAMKAWALAQWLITAATGAWTTAQLALDAAMAANPIGLIVLAVIGLVAAFVYAYKNSETFRNIVNGAFTAVKNVIMGVFNWVKSNWPYLLGILIGPFGLAVAVIYKHWSSIRQGATDVKNWIVGAFNSVVSFITGLGPRMLTAGKGFMKSLWDGIRSGVGNVGGFVADLGSAIRNGVNGLLHLPIHIPVIDTHIPGVGKVGGETLIPALAKGGIVTSPTLAMVGEAGPEAVIPLNRAKAGFGGGDITIQVSGALDPTAVGRQIAGILEQYVGRGNRIVGVTT